MPHLSFEFSRGLEDLTDLDAFAATCRDALVGTGACPIGGIRVRGFRADFQAIGDSAGTYHFLDMILRLGQGRSTEIRESIADALYEAAQTVLRPDIEDIPFILSLEVQEIDARFSRKSWSTIHTAIENG